MLKIPPPREWAEKSEKNWKKHPGGTSFSKNDEVAKGKKGYDSTKPDALDEYANYQVERDPHGMLSISYIKDGEGYREFQDGSGTGWMIDKNGAFFQRITNNFQQFGKGGSTSTFMGPSDAQTQGTTRTSYGSQNPNVHAGYHGQFNGDRSTNIAGIDVTATGGTSGTINCGLGKCALNYSQIGLGANEKGTKAAAWMRLMPPSENENAFILQVKPEGEDGGITTFKIDHKGNLSVKTEGAITYESSQGMTIKAPTLKIDAAVTIAPSSSAMALKVKGNVDVAGKMVSGVHIDPLGPHTA